jgi:hypothetical protein
MLPCNVAQRGPRGARPSGQGQYDQSYRGGGGSYGRQQGGYQGYGGYDDGYGACNGQDSRASHCWRPMCSSERVPPNKIVEAGFSLQLAVPPNAYVL